MDPITPSESVHPAGESTAPVSTAWPIDTPGGRYYAEWEPDAPVSVHGQLAFFAQFLHAGKRWDEFIAGCPLHYRGNRGSGARNVFGTAALSVLCGHWRYLHMNAVRGDVLNAGLLGISHLVSDDVVRHALNHVMEESAALAWLSEHQRRCLEPLLTLPWILDIDSTVKPLYGRQQGAEIGYNPHKPGRPSHVYHSYFVAGLRLCVGVEVLPGKEHAAGHGQPGLWRTLDALPRRCWPAFIRADCGYGQEKLMCECEERAVPYLFKLRFTKKVRELVSSMRHNGAGWEDTADGWQVLESTLRLTGWSSARRIVIVREAAARAPVEENPAHRAAPGRRRGKDRSLLPGAEAPGWQSAAPWSGKLAVLVTSLGATDYPAASLAKLYRERADMENNYDELKNQWGWNGYTTKKLAPCRIMANLIALIYNWWHLYTRLFDEEHQREAITSRPALLSGVARETRHGGQRRVKVSLLHEKGDLIAQAITLISSFLHRVSTITPRWTARQCWSLLLTRILRGKLGGKWLGDLPPGAQPLLSG
jgi:hypothetical protein